MGWKALALVVALTGCNLETKTPAEQLAEVKSRDDCYLIYAASAKTNLTANIARDACDRKFGPGIEETVRSIAGMPGLLDFDWTAVATSEKYISFPPEKREKIKRRYFDATVAFRVRPEQRTEAYSYWMAWTDQIDQSLAQPKLTKPNYFDRFDDTGSSPVAPTEGRSPSDPKPGS